MSSESFAKTQAWLKKCLAPEAFVFGQPTSLKAQVKGAPEDFLVTEQPAYLPSGDGDHLFLWVEKRGVSAHALVRHVAQGLSISEADVGSAGLKDTVAITRQWLSVPYTAGVLALVEQKALDTPAITVMDAARHTNKLKTGHLVANHFVIRLKEVQGLGSAAERERVLASRLEHIRHAGFINAYGPQRFGREGQTLIDGLGLLGVLPQRSRLGGAKKRLALSSVQSALFNRWLCLRENARGITTPFLGDVMMVVASHGPFWAEDLSEIKQRLKNGQVVVSGPMFGPKMRQARGDAQHFETDTLCEAGLSIDHFARHKKLCQGTRRASCVVPTDLESRWEDDKTLVLSFGLPPGAYATVLLAQILNLSAV